MADSIQHKIGRVRPPRVQITYDVETGGAIEMKELPFVVGVMADLAGKTKADKYKERKFVQVDNESFDSFLASIQPTLEFPVPNRLKGKGNIGVNMTFEKMKDFHPLSIIDQVPEIKDAYQIRQALNALLAKLFVNDDLTSALNDLIKDSTTDDELKAKLKELKNKL